MDLTDATVLITGGAGCIGSNLTRRLIGCARRIVVMDDLSSAERWNVPSHPSVRFLLGDVTHDRALAQAFSSQPAVVFHLAALFANQNSIDHPRDDLRVNGLGTLKLLEFAQRMGVGRVVYASSGCSVYGHAAPLPVSEDFLSLHLDTPYQITKLLGELYCNYFHARYSLPVVRARFFNVFGPGEVPGRYRNVIPNFVYHALRGEPLPITGTGEETRDFTFVSDIVDGVLACVERDEAVGEAINLASGRETRIIDIARRVNSLTGNRAGVVFTDRRDWDRISRRCASIAKAERLLGYHPSVGVDRGVPQVVNWIKANFHRIERSMRKAERSVMEPLAVAV